MPTTTAPPREALVEAVATVDAASRVFRELLGADDATAAFFEAIAMRRGVLGHETTFARRSPRTRLLTGSRCTNSPGSWEPR